MHIRAPAIFVAGRQHGETALIAQFLTQEFGLIAAYVAGGRGSRLRPVAIAGNRVDLQLSSRSASHLPFATMELLESRGAWLGEPLPAAAIGWVCALTATALPERQPYPVLYDALGGLLDAICHAPSARGWVGALAAYETLLLRELGYGSEAPMRTDDFASALDQLDTLGTLLDRYLLADRRGDVMAARSRLRKLLGRML